MSFDETPKTPKAQTLIMIVLIFSVVLLAIGLIWCLNTTVKSSNDLLEQFNLDLVTIRKIMIDDAHLQRLLMIEIVNNTSHSNSIESDAVTFEKMSTGISLFGKALIRSFGVTIAQRITTLMHKRNKLLREYYGVICNLNIMHNEVGSLSQSMSTLDMTTLAHRNLEAVTREITDNIGAFFHIRDVDQTHNKNKPVVHFQRLFNLIIMYDKELINQAKSYASHQYDISMNCAQSSLEITHHISDELSTLMNESQQTAQTQIKST